MLRTLLFIVIITATACEQTQAPEEAEATAALSWETPQDSSHMLFSVEGLSGPEAVRYDPDQDVYFVSNFNGDNAGDANGFISRVSADGQMEQLEFMVGTDEYPLHGPRGMFIVGDTLWVADADGVHGFDRVTGAQEAFIDFSSIDHGFLNDISQGTDEALYVTDTGRMRVYRVLYGDIETAIQDSAIGNPNGITWDEEGERFVLAPWNSANTFQTFQIGSTELTPLGESEGQNFDGIEMVDGRALVASQWDSSLRIVENGIARPYINLPGRPADIAIDTRRNRVAVPYISLNRVDVWALPASK